MNSFETSGMFFCIVLTEVGFKSGSKSSSVLLLTFHIRELGLYSWTTPLSLFMQRKLTQVRPPDASGGIASTSNFSLISLARSL